MPLPAAAATAGDGVPPSSSGRPPPGAGSIVPTVGGSDGPALGGGISAGKVPAGCGSTSAAGGPAGPSSDLALEIGRLLARPARGGGRRPPRAGGLARAGRPRLGVSAGWAVSSAWRRRPRPRLRGLSAAAGGLLGLALGGLLGLAAGGLLGLALGGLLGLAAGGLLGLALGGLLGLAAGGLLGLARAASSASRRAVSSASRWAASSAWRRAVSSAWRRAASRRAASSAWRRAVSSASRWAASSAWRRAVSSASRWAASSAWRRAASSASRWAASSAWRRAVSSASRWAASSACAGGLLGLAAGGLLGLALGGLLGLAAGGLLGLAAGGPGGLAQVRGLLGLALGGLLGLLAGLFLRLFNGPFQHPEQPLGTNIEPARAELKCLPARQLGKACRQLVGAGHPGPFHQDGDDADIACQRSFDFQPDEVVGVIQAPPPVLAGGREPPVADQRQQYVAGSHRGGDHLDEVIAQFNRVDVLEDLASGEVTGQPLIQPAGGVGSIFAAVAHEDPARKVTGGCSHDLDPCCVPDPYRLAQPSKAARHAAHATGWLAWWHRLILMAQRMEAKRIQGAGNVLECSKAALLFAPLRRPRETAQRQPDSCLLAAMKNFPAVPCFAARRIFARFRALTGCLLRTCHYAQRRPLGDPQSRAAHIIR